MLCVGQNNLGYYKALELKQSQEITFEVQTSEIQKLENYYKKLANV